MTPAQRSALLGMLDAILAVKHCPDAIRTRAEDLQANLSPVAALYRRLGMRFA